MRKLKNRTKSAIRLRPSKNLKEAKKELTFPEALQLFGIKEEQV